MYGCDTGCGACGTGCGTGCGACGTGCGTGCGACGTGCGCGCGACGTGCGCGCGACGTGACGTGCGACGTGCGVGATGVTLLLDTDGKDIAITELSEFLVLNVIVNVYAVPFVSPVTVIGLDVPVPVIPPGLDVTVYKLLVDGFPKYVGAVKVTVACVFPAVAEGLVGAPG